MEFFYERNFQRFGEVTLIRLTVLQRNQYSEARKDSEVLSYLGRMIESPHISVCVEGTCHVHVTCVHFVVLTKEGGVRKGVNQIALRGE